MSLHKTFALLFATTMALTLLTGCVKKDCPWGDQSGTVIGHDIVKVGNLPTKYNLRLSGTDGKEETGCARVKHDVYDSHKEGDFYPRKGDK